MQDLLNKVVPCENKIKIVSEQMPQIVRKYKREPKKYGELFAYLQQLEVIAQAFNKIKEGKLINAVEALECLKSIPIQEN